MRRDEALAVLRRHLPMLVREFKVRHLALVGSTARDEARPDSDVDLLVEFEETPSFDRYMELKFFLEEALQTPVDLGSWKAVRARVRAALERDAIRVA